MSHPKTTRESCESFTASTCHTRFGTPLLSPAHTPKSWQIEIVAARSDAPVRPPPPLLPPRVGSPSPGPAAAPRSTFDQIVAAGRGQIMAAPRRSCRRRPPLLLVAWSMAACREANRYAPMPVSCARSSAVGSPHAAPFPRRSRDPHVRCACSPTLTRRPASRVRAARSILSAVARTPPNVCRALVSVTAPRLTARAPVSVSSGATGVHDAGACGIPHGSAVKECCTRAVHAQVRKRPRRGSGRCGAGSPHTHADTPATSCADQSVRVAEGFQTLPHSHLLA